MQYAGRYIAALGSIVHYCAQNRLCLCTHRTQITYVVQFLFLSRQFDADFILGAFEAPDGVINQLVKTCATRP